MRAAPVLAVDLNHGHLDAWTVTPDGNPAGPPVTIPLVLAGLPASQRDGRLRAAISELTRIARQHSCRAVVIEDLDFAGAREQGRERHGSRPSRGRRGRSFRQIVAGLPTRKFRDRLTQMAANAGVAVIAADPAYTSRWGREHWLAPLQDRASPVAPVAVHHAAAVVIGRRALGHRARRRAGVTGNGQRTARRRAAPRAPAARRTDRNGRPRKAQRQPPPWQKTATAKRTRPPDQAAQDRSGPLASQDHVLLAHQERLMDNQDRRSIGRFRQCRRSGVIMTEQAPRIDYANIPAPAEGILVTMFITVRKVARSRDFYSRVLGGTVVLDENPCIVKLSNSWIIMNPGGPPTPDKPGISVIDYEPGNTTSIFLNLRVADIQACYEEWRAKGAEFVTPPIDRGAEIRCYLRDPDGYLIEVGQSTGLLNGQLAAKRPEDLPG